VSVSLNKPEANLESSARSSREKILHQLDSVERDFAESVQRVRDRERIFCRSFIERYIKGQISVILDFHSLRGRNGDGQDFAHSAPSYPFRALTRLVFHHNVNYSRYMGQGNQKFVLVPDVQVVNCAEESIPSLRCMV
jgi:hypothetical protein